MYVSSGQTVHTCTVAASSAPNLQSVELRQGCGREGERGKGREIYMYMCASMIVEVHVHVATHGMQETDMPLGTVVIADVYNYSLTDSFKWHDI